jgi:C1A family cysteine protease
MNELPVDDHVPNAKGTEIYNLCKAIDNDGQDGSTIRTLAKVLQNLGLLKTYAFASTIEEVKQFVLTQGPICWGIGWTHSMFFPDANGLVVPSGPDVGGHAITEVGYDPTTDLHELLNHWGPKWSLNGRFYMTSSALADRLANGGEAMAAVEIGA